MSTDNSWSIDAPELVGLNIELPHPETAIPTPPAPTLPQQVTTTHAGQPTTSTITLDQLIARPASTWAHLETKIVEARDWVQRALTDQGLAQKVEEARSDPEIHNEIAQTIDRLCLQYITSQSLTHGEDTPHLIASVISEIAGLGPLDPLLNDPTVTEVMVNGPNSCFVEIAGKVHPVPGVSFRDKEHLLEMCQRILRPLNRSVDQRNPLEDGRLPDGARVNIVHPSIAADGPVLTIRRFGDSVWTLEKLTASGGITEDLARYLAWLVRGRVSLLISGGTGSGKTTALNAIAGVIPRNERLLTVEDSRELRLPAAAHVVALEARPAAANGEGGISIRQLVRNALRMRPSRIIVGEVRDAAAVDMLTAMNTGHEGSLTTLHANGPEEVPDRLAVMIAQSGEIPAPQVARFLSSAVDVIVHIRRYEDGSRRIASLHQVLRGKENPQPDNVTLLPLWEWNYQGTDQEGTVQGKYEIHNDLTPGLLKDRRLTQTPLPTWDDIQAWSDGV